MQKYELGPKIHEETFISLFTPVLFSFVPYPTHLRFVLDFFLCFSICPTFLFLPLWKRIKADKTAKNKRQNFFDFYPWERRRRNKRRQKNIVKNRGAEEEKSCKTRKKEKIRFGVKIIILHSWHKHKTKIHLGQYFINKYVNSCKIICLFTNLIFSFL